MLDSIHNGVKITNKMGTVCLNCILMEYCRSFTKFALLKLAGGRTTVNPPWGEM